MVSNNPLLTHFHNIKKNYLHRPPQKRTLLSLNRIPLHTLQEFHPHNLKVKNILKNLLGNRTHLCPNRIHLQNLQKSHLTNLSSHSQRKRKKKRFYKTITKHNQNIPFSLHTWRAPSLKMKMKVRKGEGKNSFYCDVCLWRSRRLECFR